MSEYTPITGELRAAMHPWGWVESDGSITFSSSSMPPSIDAEKALAISGSDFDRCCDAIDAIHAQLERENESLKAELDRVLGEQEDERHTAGESITGELRKYISGTSRCGISPTCENSLVNIADRIDEAYGHACWCYEDEFDGWKFIHDTEFVEMPKDADGKPIRVGDVMVGEKVGGGYCEPFEVTGYVMSNGVIEPMDEHKIPRIAKYAHHHAPDTWESIIEDALSAKWSSRGERSADFDAFVARCKKLAGDAE